MTNRRVLFVDDDPKILTSVRRQFEDDFEVETAERPALALEMIESTGPFAVIVSDMRMPEMDGIALLSVVKERFPQTVRVLLTGFADLETAIAAINQGDVFRFLSKPCKNEYLRSVIEDGIRRHNGADVPSSESQAIGFVEPPNETGFFSRLFGVFGTR